MKKLNLGNINAGLSTIKELANENAGIARDELIDVSLIDFANKNTYAANDTNDSIRDLADQIETVGLLNPLGVIQSGNRYKLFPVNADTAPSHSTYTGTKSRAEFLKAFRPDVHNSCCTSQTADAITRPSKS